METVDQIRLKNLRRLVEEMGGVPKVANAYGCGESYIRQLLLQTKTHNEKPKSIGGATARKFENIAHKPVGWLDQPNEHDDPTSKTAKLSNLRVAQESAPYPVTTENVVPINRVAVSARCGRNGLASPDEYVMEHIQVHRDWLVRTVGSALNVGRLNFIEAYGDSMRPNICSGDLLLVDTGRKSVDRDGVFILLRTAEFGEEIMVKRVTRKIAGGYVISSDNQNYPPEELSSLEFEENVSVRGLVVFVWNGRKMF